MTREVEGPIRRGDLYCSAWCGFGCGWKAHQQATAEAAALAKQCGPDWEPHVWENAGWHYEVRRGVCRITATIRGDCISGGWTATSYTAWINTIPQFISSRQPTPEEAFQEALAKMIQVFDDLAGSMKPVMTIGLEMRLSKP